MYNVYCIMCIVCSSGAFLVFKRETDESFPLISRSKSKSLTDETHPSWLSQINRQMFTKTNTNETLPEAQRTQGIESILSKSLNKNSLKLISVKLLELVANLATRWRHLHWLPILPPDAPLAY